MASFDDMAREGKLTVYERADDAPLTDGESGLRVVRVLEALQRDLERSRRA